MSPENVILQAEQLCLWLSLRRRRLCSPLTVRYVKLRTVNTAPRVLHLLAELGTVWRVHPKNERNGTLVSFICFVRMCQKATSSSPFSVTACLLLGSRLSINGSAVVDVLTIIVIVRNHKRLSRSEDIILLYDSSV